MPAQQSPPTQPGQPQTPSAQAAVQGGTTQQRAGSTHRRPAGQPTLHPVAIDELVETDVATAERDTPIPTIVAQMAENDVGSVVIVEDDKPIGIVTDRQIALSLETTPDLADRTATDLVEGNLITGTMNMTVFEALRQLEEARIRRLPIVDDEGTLEGIVTLDDILVLLGAELGNATEIIKAQSPRL